MLLGSSIAVTEQTLTIKNLYKKTHSVNKGSTCFQYDTAKPTILKSNRTQPMKLRVQFYSQKVFHDDIFARTTSFI